MISHALSQKLASLFVYFICLFIVYLLFFSGLWPIIWYIEWYKDTKNPLCKKTKQTLPLLGL